MQDLLSQYLEQSLSTFLDQQDSMQRQMQRLIDANPINLMKKMSDRNLNMMKTFTAGQDKEDSDKGAQ